MPRPRRQIFVSLCLSVLLVGGWLGAAPVSREFAITAADRAHWAFQRVKRIGVMEYWSNGVVQAAASGRRSITLPIRSSCASLVAFPLAKLHAAGITFSPPATKEAQLRRVSLGLIGLPPSLAELDAFLADTSPDAWEKVVDRLLASMHYSERWGPALAGPRALRGHGGLRARRDAPERVALSRLRGALAQRGQTLRPLRARANRRRRTLARRPRRAHRHGVQPHRPGHDGQLGPDSAPVQHAQRHDGCDGFDVPRPDDGLRAVPRPQVRADCATGLHR